MSIARFALLAAAVLALPGAARAQSTAALAATPLTGLRSRPDTQIVLAHAVAANRDVETDYDKSRNLTTVEVKPFDPGGGLDLRIAASYTGRAPNAKPDSVRLVFVSSGFRWTYGARHDLTLALPDASILHYGGSRVWKSGTESHPEREIGPIAIEIMTFEVPWADVQHLIRAGSAVGMLGPTQVELGPRRVAAIADFVTRIAPAD